MKVHSPYWPEASIFRRFFLSFFLFYLSFFLSLSFSKRNEVCQTVVCTEMTGTSDDKPTQEVSGPWQAFIYDPTSPLRTDEPVNRIYRWKWRSIAASCLESTIRAWEIIAPISHWIFFLFFACPSHLNPFPLFLCFPLIPWDRSMRHALCVRLLCSVWGSVWWWAERKNRIFIVIQICWARFSFS